MTGADDRTAVLPWRRDAGAVLHHGPRRREVHAGHRIADITVHGPLPYHGILPRSLLTVPPAARGTRAWDWAAPVFEEVLTRLTTARLAGGVEDLATTIADARRDLCAAWPDRVSAAPPEEVLRDWVAAAVEAGVLSYTQSAAVA